MKIPCSTDQQMGQINRIFILQGGIKKITGGKTNVVHFAGGKVYLTLILIICHLVRQRGIYDIIIPRLSDTKSK